MPGWVLALLLILAQPALAGEGHAHHGHHDHASHAGSHTAPTQVPSYIENKGQWHERVHFRAEMGPLTVFAEGDRITYALISAEDLDATHDLRHDRGREDAREALEAFPIRGHAFALRPIAARLSTPFGEGQQPSRYHYYKGQDPARWASGVSGYDGVVMPDLWPGIDWHLSAQDGSPKYEFVLDPGVSPKGILLRYEGLEALRLEGGNLHLQTSLGELVEAAPYAYQMDAQGNEIPVACRFDLRDGVIGFELPEGYDATRRLVIDPVLVGSTYSGTSGSSQYGFTATFGPNEDIFGGGQAFGAGLPTSLSAFQTTFGGGVDMAISRFTPGADAVVWASYIGGSNSDLPHSMICDPAGNLVVMGTSSSADYPTTPGAYDGTFAGSSFSNDIVVSKLSPDGTAMLASTYIGGSDNDGSNGDFSLLPNYGDSNRGEVNFDGSGNIIVASVTRSSDFPTTAGAFDTNLGGSQDAVVFSLSSDLSTLNWSTFLGGSNTEAGCALKADLAGNIVVVGATKSGDFPTTPGAWSTTYGGGATDGFMTRLNSTGSILDASTYIGGPQQEIAYFVEIDDDGYAYAAGNCGPGFPVSPGVYNVPNSTQFIFKMMNDWSAPIWSTQYGAGTGFGQEMAPTAFLVDVCGNIYFGGFTEENMPVTADAIKPTVDFFGDFHFIVLQPDAAGLLYGTFFGGSGWEHVDGGTSRYSKNGIVYQASCTNSVDFPVTPTTIYPGPGPSWDRVTFAIDFEFAGVDANFAAIGGTISGCVPFTVPFENLSNGSDTYFWDFGTGVPTDTSSLFEPTFTFVDTGFYEVMLIASTSDTSSTCQDADTATLLIEVHDRRIAADLDFVQDCSINSVDFSNLSDPPGTANWDFGDGNTSAQQNPEHTFQIAGNYVVCLTAISEDGCEDAFCREINIAQQVFLPNAFSPNGDGLNDHFAPISQFVLNNYLFQIFNRWGELIFEANEPGTGWDGTFKGVEQEGGVYIYVLRAAEIEGVLKGTVTLVR